MKKFLVLLMALGLLFTGVAVFAGSIDYLSNQSAEYIRTLNRNGSTDAADIANYNPAGLTELADGIYFNLSNQFIFKPYKITQSGTSYEQDEPTLLLPNFYAAWSQGDWAAFASFQVVAGGGTLKFDDGVPASGGMPLEATSMYLGFSIGGAYAINDMFSVSLTGRVVKANKEAELTDNNSDVKVDAIGYTGVIGLNIKPMPGLNIGMRYELETRLKWDTSTSGALGSTLAKSFNSADGEKFKNDLPAIAALGVTYMVMPGLQVGAGITYYFLKSMTIESSAGKDVNNYGDGFETGAFVAYTVMPGLLCSIGYLYNHMGTNTDSAPADRTITDTGVNLNSNTVGLGARYDVLPNLVVNLGLSGTFYQTTDVGNETYKRRAYDIAIGAQYRM